MTDLTQSYSSTNWTQMWIHVLKFVAVPIIQVDRAEKKARRHKFFPELLAVCSVFEVRA